MVWLILPGFPQQPCVSLGGGDSSPYERQPAISVGAVIP